MNVLYMHLKQGFSLALVFSFYFISQVHAQKKNINEINSAVPFYFPQMAEDVQQENPVDHEKSPGAVIFSENFSVNLNTWTTEGTDGALWMHDNDGPSGQFALPSEIINSQSVNNGFAIFDADLSNPGPGPFTNRTGCLVSPIINLSGINNAILFFTHKYRFCCNTDFYPQLEISTNNFLTKAIYNVSIPGTVTNSASITHKTKVNISEFLDTASNLNNFKLRFNFDGSNGTSEYYWQIDDVSLIESNNYDLALLNADMVMGAMKLPYYFLPLSQNSPVQFSVNVRVDGALTATNVKLEVNAAINGGAVQSLPTELLPNQLDSLVADLWFPPLGIIAPYTINYTVSQDSSDSYSQDNAFNDYINVTDHIFSIDNNTPTGYISNIASQPSEPLKIGNVMEVFNNDIIDSMFVFITATSTNVSQLINGEIRKKVNGNWVVLGTTLPIQITTINNGSSVGLSFPSPISVTAGDTLLVLACHNGGAQAVRFRIAQSVQEGVVMGIDASGSLFYIPDPNTLMVRLNMGEYIEVEENLSSNKLKIFPNPVSDFLSFEFSTIDFKDILIQVTDINGREVFQTLFPESANGELNASIRVSDLKPGIYYLTISANEIISVKRFIKN